MRRAIFVRIAGALVVFLLVLAAWLGGHGRLLAAAAPVLGYLLVMLAFARTLRRGREPLITAFCRIDFGELPDECRGYTRGLTVLWAVLMGALAVEALALPLLGRDAWLGTACLLNGGLMLIVFLGEHWVRALVFPHLPAGSPLRTGRIMLQSLRGR